jgi:hypothetical protein
MRFASQLAAFMILCSPAFAADVYNNPVSYRHAPVSVIIQSGVPACDNPLILRDVQRRFSQKERAYWNSNLFISGFQDVRSVVYRPWGPHMIERQFCTAQVVLSDNSLSRAHYAIARRTGFAGTNYGVEWCVEGFDRNMAFAPDCKMAQP